MTLIASAMWLAASSGINTHAPTQTHTHTSAHTLSSALRWQAVIPALAYERQQLEGVAVTVVARLLCYPFGWQLLCSC